MKKSDICQGLLQKNEKSIGLFTLDYDYKIKSWSKGCENIFGYTNKEIKDKSIFDTIIPSYSAFGLKEDFRLKKELDFSQIEFLLKDKTTKFFNIIARYSDDGITILLFSNSQKEKKQNHISSIIKDNLTRDVVIVLDQNGYIKEFNKEASFLTGYKKEDVLDRNFIKLFVPTIYQEKILYQIQSTFKKKEISIRDNYPIICKDGTKKIVYWNYNIVNHSHRQKRLFVTSQNQTKESIITQKLDYLASYDSLTDLPNKNLFLKELQNSMNKVATSKNLNLLLTILDIKNFKSINHAFGIKAGDKLLTLIAKRLNNKLRDYDLIARIDGDRFAIIFDNIPNELYYVKIVHRLQELFKTPFEIDKNSINLDVSIGSATYPSDANSIDNLLSSCEFALQKAKECKGSCYRFFMPSMYDDISKRSKLEKNIKDALKNDEFFVLYQPQIDTKTSTISGVEALVRWNHPELENIPPLDFIPVAEDSGLILEIGKTVLEKSIKDIKELHKNGWDDLTLSVNISAVQLLQSNLLDTVNSFLKKYDFNPKLLHLELTESVFMDNLELSSKLLKEFRELGIKISIDDFGTGYSSLSYISSLPIDILKIDKSFITSIDKNSKAPIVDAIISMAHSLNLKVVAEGVENKVQNSYLTQKECDFIQGYYYSEPISYEKLHSLMQKKYLTPKTYLNKNITELEKELKVLINNI